MFAHGPVFRIGGDEFTVLLQRGDLANCDKLLAEFEEGMAGLTLETDDGHEPVSIALGIAHFESGDTTFSDVFRRADADMYRRKTEMKAEQQNGFDE